MRGISIFLCACVVLGAVASAQASLIGLEMAHFPRVASNGIAVDYIAPTGGETLGTLTAFGDAWDIYSSIAPEAEEAWGFFDLTVVIDSTTGTAVSGELYVDDDTYGFIFSSTTIETVFGFGGNDLFEFKFTQVGNSGLPTGPQDGDSIGVILSALSIPDAIFDDSPVIVPDWTTDFSNNWNGESDTFFLPEPTSLGLLVAGSFALLRRRK